MMGIASVRRPTGSSHDNTQERKEATGYIAIQTGVASPSLIMALVKVLYRHATRN